MFSFGSSTGATGNPLFPSTTNTTTQPSSQPQSTTFQFGATPSSSTSIGAGTTGTTGTDGMFKFGTSTPTTTGTAAPSTFNYGGIYQIFYTQFI